VKQCIFDAFVHMNDRQWLCQKFWGAGSIQKFADEDILLSRRMADLPFEPEFGTTDHVL
jgi:hypothetical protein